jgi:hypothetical protein
MENKSSGLQQARDDPDAGGKTIAPKGGVYAHWGTPTQYFCDRSPDRDCDFRKQVFYTENWTNNHDTDTPPAADL